MKIRYLIESIFHICRLCVLNLFASNYFRRQFNTISAEFLNILSSSSDRESHRNVSINPKHKALDVHDFPGCPPLFWSKSHCLQAVELLQCSIEYNFSLCRCIVLYIVKFNETKIRHLDRMNVIHRQLQAAGSALFVSIRSLNRTRETLMNWVNIDGRLGRRCDRK